MTKKPHAPTRSSAMRTTATSPQWGPDPLFDWTGVRWMSIGLQAWTLWLRQYSAALQPWRGGVDDVGGDSAGDDRRGAALPWLPRMESTVVPFRRRDDQPGAEGEKLSMRIQVPPLPWENGGGSVIKIDSLRPRRVEPTNGKSSTGTEDA